MTGVAGSGRVAVVGGGIAGLAAAHHLLSTGRVDAVTVLEGSPETGGKLRLGTLAGQPLDLGAESFLARRTEAVDLAHAVGLADGLTHPVGGAGVWTRGRVRPLPPTLLGIPADLPALERSGVVSESAVALAALEETLPPIDVHEDVAVGALVAERLGPEIRDQLVEPLLGGVYAGRSDELSFLAAVPQLAAAVAAKGGLLAAARSVATPTLHGPVFAGVRGGVGRLAQATTADIERLGGTVRVNAMARELARTPQGWTLVTGPTIAPVTESFDAVILATPAVATARLLMDVAPRAAGELAAIEYASMAVVSLAFATGDITNPLQGTGFLVPPIDGHVIKASTFSSSKWSWHEPGVIQVRCSVGRWRDERELQRDDDELVRLALADLADAVGLTAPPIDSSVTRWGGALPQYVVGHLDRVARIRSSVAAMPGLDVCGAAYGGVGIPAVIADARAAATRVAEGLSGPATMGT